MIMKLYKYMPAKYALDALQTRRIKVSTASDANDPNEMIPNFTDELGRPMIVSRDRKTQFQKCNLEKHAFISLSSEYDSNCMWGFYGDKFRGMALVFDVDVEREVGELFPVRYAAMRMVLSEQGCGEMSDPRRQDEIARGLFAQKDRQWSFENEWRRYVGLRNCERKLLDNGETGYFASLDNVLNLTGVVLGPECSFGIGAVQSALRDHESDGVTITILCHDVETYAVRIAYREIWRQGNWRPYASCVM